MTPDEHPLGRRMARPNPPSARHAKGKVPNQGIPSADALSEKTNLNPSKVPQR